MGFHHYERRCAMIQTLPRLFLTAFAVAMALASSASAGIIGTTYSLRLEGHVKKNASTAVEKYTATPVFDANPTDVPGVLIPPGGVFNAPNTLSVTESDAANSSVIWLSNKGQPLFANTLDSTFLVEFEADLHWDNVGPTEKIVVSNFGLENGNFPPYFAPVTQSVTGFGSVANPLKIVLGFNSTNFTVGGLANFNIAKIHFDWTKMDNGIPEPATCALALVGMVGGCGLMRRRS